MSQTTRTRTALAAVVVACAAAGSLSPAAHAAPAAERTDAATSGSLEAFEAQVLTEVNAARGAEGLKPIRFADPCVERMAEKWGARIARTGVLQHRSQSQVIRKCKQAWAGETLIRGYDLTPASMVEAWMASPGHREILMSTNARRAGVAVVVDSQDRMIGVVNVSRPSRR